MNIDKDVFSHKLLKPLFHNYISWKDTTTNDSSTITVPVVLDL